MWPISTWHTAASLLAAVFFPSSASAYSKLSNRSLANLPLPGDDFDIHNGALLAPILRVRIPGTPEIEEVRHHFLDFFNDNLPKWEVHYDNSTQMTALGKELPFVNLVMTRKPPWANEGEIGMLTLVAHYDSKLTPTGFIGATDSAAPCAMLMHVARSIDSALTKKWEQMQASGNPEQGLSPDEGIQIIFLDGEEAFHQWSATDSLYGARALAQKWDETMHPAMSTFHSNISSISLFVLLDLLGSAHPTVPSYFPTTHWAYQAMADLEKRLRSLRLFTSSPNHPSKNPGASRPVREPLFLHEKDKDIHGSFMGGYIEDDHVPFMARGVEVLHMIPSPFPDVWHTPIDDGEHLHIPTVVDWAQLVTAFTAEWLDLEQYLPPTEQNSHSKREADQGEELGDAERAKDELDY